MSESKKRAEVLATYRTHFPSPNSCTDAVNRLPTLRAQLVKDQTTGSKVNGPRWVEAGQTVIAEFEAYIANCNRPATSTIPSADNPLYNADSSTLPSGGGGGGVTNMSLINNSSDPGSPGISTKAIIIGGVSLLLLVVVVVVIKKRK